MEFTYITEKSGSKKQTVTFMKWTDGLRLQATIQFKNGMVASVPARHLFPMRPKAVR